MSINLLYEDPNFAVVELSDKEAEGGKGYSLVIFNQNYTLTKRQFSTVVRTPSHNLEKVLDSINPEIVFTLKENKSSAPALGLAASQAYIEKRDQEDLQEARESFPGGSG